MNTELDICIGVHVDDMLAAGPSELTKNLLQELSILGRSLCLTPQGYTFGVSSDYVTKLCKDFGMGELKGSNTLNCEKRDDYDYPGRIWTTTSQTVCLVGYSGWIVLTSRMQFVNCPLTSAQLPLVMKSTSSVC